MIAQNRQRSTSPMWFEGAGKPRSVRNVDQRPLGESSRGSESPDVNVGVAIFGET